MEIYFEDETAEEFAVGKIEDFTQHQLIDLYCTHVQNVDDAQICAQLQELEKRYPLWISLLR